MAFGIITYEFLSIFPFEDGGNAERIAAVRRYVAGNFNTVSGQHDHHRPSKKGIDCKMVHNANSDDGGGNHHSTDVMDCLV